MGDDLPSAVIGVDQVVGRLLPAAANCSLAGVRNAAIEAVERQYLELLLTQCQGRINQTAQAAGIGTRQLRKLLTKYGIRKEGYKPGGSRRRSAAR